ncbi:DNA polymerase III subunit epsilon [Fastidiosibacter lacustris]|uniref:DNA polymerase III subunit epsilon n=1 Tax=Fastidiosibacter lacustris TaxID=2056695 RepID=UPI000E34654A|nr:DNA polymerase III subunit epsilon [Fastidiosibacter lacustris]
MRQIFVDTETTGFDYKAGHRIIEFGAVEMISRKLTGKNLHFYFKPDIEVEAGAFQVHGISNEFLADKPLFADKIDEIIAFLQGSELIIHNAAFDLPFLNWELQHLKSNKWGQIENHCTIIDSLLMAREKHPGQKNSLDALCSRYGVNNKHRALHGALLDSELLAEVYLLMTGGQLNLFNLSDISDNTQTHLLATSSTIQTHAKAEEVNKIRLIDLLADNCTPKAHEEYLTLLDKKSKGNALWRKL